MLKRKTPRKRPRPIDYAFAEMRRLDKQKAPEVRASEAFTTETPMRQDSDGRSPECA